MLLKTVAVACFFGLAGGGAWAINKCIGEDGRVSFQDAPCRGAGGAIASPASIGGRGLKLPTRALAVLWAGHRPPVLAGVD